MPLYKKPDKIVLWPEQVVNYKKTIEIWESGETCSINNSVMGTGKTPVTCKLAQLPQFDLLLVICPANICWIWYDHEEKYGLNIIVLSYETLSSSVNQQPKHDFLTRCDDDEEEEETDRDHDSDYDEDEKEVTKKIFEVTQEFKKICKKGVLLVADEFHRLKNKNSRYMAFKALTDYIYKKKDTGDSKILLLSGSPFSEKEHTSNIMQLINIIQDDNMFKYIKSEQRLILSGMKELLKYCKNKNPEVTENILIDNSLTHKTVYDIAFLLYINIVQKYIVTAMPSPVLKSNLYCYNAYFNMTESESKKLNKSISLVKSSSVNKEKVSDNDVALTTALRLKQIDKICIYARIAKILLERDETNKVCIFLDFDDPINNLEKALEDYDPILVTGKTNKHERPIIIKKFQEANTKSRLLIFNTAVGCEGISLDDTDGRFKRFILVEPSFYILRMHQLTRRFLRVNTKSDTIMYCVYGNCGINETNIINSLARKTNVMKETLKLQVSEGIVFPGDYEQLSEKGYSKDDFEMEEVEKVQVEEIKEVSKGVKSITKKGKTRNLILESNICNNSFVW